MRYLTVIVVFIALYACAASDEEEIMAPQWTTLEQAMNALYSKDFNKYLSFVDSLSIQDKKEIVIQTIRQKYLDTNPWDSNRVRLSDIQNINDSCSDVFFKIYSNRMDTVYSVQRMVLRDGNWKIKLF